MNLRSNRSTAHLHTNTSQVQYMNFQVYVGKDEVSTKYLIIQNKRHNTSRSTLIQLTRITKHRSTYFEQRRKLIYCKVNGHNFAIFKNKSFILRKLNFHRLSEYSNADIKIYKSTFLYFRTTLFDNLKRKRNLILIFILAHA